jgi:hypothetical protein
MIFMNPALFLYSHELQLLLLPSVIIFLFGLYKLIIAIYLQTRKVCRGKIINVTPIKTDGFRKGGFIAYADVSVEGQDYTEIEVKDLSGKKNVPCPNLKEETKLRYKFDSSGRPKLYQNNASRIMSIASTCLVVGIILFIVISYAWSTFRALG